MGMKYHGQVMWSWPHGHFGDSIQTLGVVSFEVYFDKYFMIVPVGKINTL